MTAGRGLWWIARRLLHGVDLLPFGQEALAVELHAVQIHRVDLPRVVDVVKRVSIEHDEAGPLTRSDRAHVGQAEELCRTACRGHDRVRRRETEVDPAR